MAIRVALNGFGRIGRNVLRAALNDDDIQFVHINDLTDDATLAHLLTYDSVHGRFPGEVQTVEGGLQINGQRITTSAERDPSQLPWGELDVDIVMECTGVFRDRAGASKHLSAGAKRVIISAPNGGGKTLVVEKFGLQIKAHAAASDAGPQ